MSKLDELDKEVWVLLNDLRDAQNPEQSLAIRKAIISFIHDKMSEARQEEREALKSKATEKRQSKPKGKCINAENHLFGSCFECKKIDGYNLALSDLLTHLSTSNKK